MESAESGFCMPQIQFILYVNNYSASQTNKQKKAAKIKTKVQSLACRESILFFFPNGIQAMQ